MKKHHGHPHHHKPWKKPHKHKSLHQAQAPKHASKWRNFLEKAIYPIGIMGPLFTVPQLLQVWTSKNASGLSLTTWLLWVLVAMFWLAYGIERREKPIILCYAAWVVVELGVVVGIVLYGEMTPSIEMMVYGR